MWCRPRGSAPLHGNSTRANHRQLSLTSQAALKASGIEAATLLMFFEECVVTQPWRLNGRRVYVFRRPTFAERCWGLLRWLAG